MKYYCIEYRHSKLIPGDWKWYLDSYKVDVDSGRRQWVFDNILDVRVYEIPRFQDGVVLTAIHFVPGNAYEYTGSTLPAPEGVRWGIVTCLRKDLVELINGRSLTNDLVLGSISGMDEKKNNIWVPVMIKNRFSIPIGKKDDADACLSHLKGEPLYCSDRFSLIIRDDLFQVIRGFAFHGCRISIVET